MTDGHREPSHATIAAGALSATAAAYANTPGGWTHALRAALAGLFEFLATAAPAVQECLVQDLDAGRLGLERRDELLARFTELLEPDYAEGLRKPPDAVAEAIGGSVYELVRIHALERRVAELPEAVPAATVIALTPFVGSEEAERVAATPAATHASR